MITVGNTLTISITDVLAVIQIFVSGILIYFASNLDQRLKKIDRKVNQRTQALERAHSLAKEWQQIFILQKYALGLHEDTALKPSEFFAKINVVEIDLKAIVSSIGDRELSTILEQCLATEQAKYSSDDPTEDEIDLETVRTGQVTNAKFEAYFRRLYVLIEEATR